MRSFTSAIILLPIFLAQYNVETTLSPKSPRGNKDKAKEEKSKEGPQNYSVFERNFVNESPTPKEIIANYKGFFKEVDEYRLDGLVLGYVTPVSIHV